MLGYLAAGVAIRPFGLKLFTDAGAILHIAELGVVMTKVVEVVKAEFPLVKLWVRSFERSHSLELINA